MQFNQSETSTKLLNGKKKPVFNNTPKNTAVAFFMIPRELFTNPALLENKPISKREAIIDMIFQARYEKSSKSAYIGNRLVTWSFGQVPASIRFLAKRWRWSNDKVLRFLGFLKENGFISISQNAGQTVLSINNFDFSKKQAQATDQEQLQSNTSPTMISEEGKDVTPSKNMTEAEQKPNSDKYKTNNVNKGNNGLIIKYAYDDNEFKDLFDLWTNYRKEIKKPLTQTTMDKQVEKLQKSGRQGAIEMLNHSMENGYMGLFKPNNHNENGNSKFNDAGNLRKPAYESF